MHLFFNRIIFFLELIYLIFAISCTSYFISDFTIKAYSFDDDCITIQFSSSPDLSSCKKSISVTKDGYSEYFTVYQQDDSIKIYPIAKIEQNHNYCVTISTDTENSEGKNLNSIFKWNFTTKQDFEKLQILKYETMTTGIVFEFNKKINPASFSNSFSINPSVKNMIYFQNENTKASVIFLEPQKTNERYFIKISSGFNDIYNNKLEKDFTYSYLFNSINENTTYKVYNIFESENHEISCNVLNENILNKSSFKIKFSNVIKADYINSAIKFTPPIDFTINKDIENLRELTLTLNEIPDSQTEYILSIKNDIQDINNNPLKESEFHLVFNNSKNRQIYFETLYIQTENETLEVSEDKNYQTLVLSPGVYPINENNTEKNIDFFFIFTISKDAEQIDYISAVENIAFSQTLNCIELKPVKVKIIKNQEFIQNYSSYIPVNLQNSNFNEFNFCAVKITCSATNKNQTGLINILIDKNLKDNIQNSLNGKTSISINKR
ncbi:MAG: Ig-like domain-containing protein [Treponema sp.]|nr:Ig-like domain-containing protein [Candidatus Treponema merdequi]